MLQQQQSQLQTKPFYHQLISDTFEKRLKQVIEDRDALSEKYIKLQELSLQLKSIENKKEFHTLVDVGTNFYVQGHVTDTRTIYLDVGLGFFSEFSIPKAMKFVTQQMEQLNAMIEEKKQQALIIEQNIHLALTNNGLE
ncbi:hypothetical protein FDP41_010678 [Naegleria fowleri]|uniref:Uncharacterized protein n=1 Tax=Naegleria fowleri TaxID=5763 RepID=A0A6A5BZM2_NAEFO|nr:uncharacterized protein FDP41_010678 [Naegleria fowleri]KAF0983613.1 hypothetical protein FDP41_010678 [Naegleria fowleri]CAG4716301.1 unnamed protein product [Naegleria fowleri]